MSRLLITSIILYYDSSIRKFDASTNTFSNRSTSIGMIFAEQDLD